VSDSYRRNHYVPQWYQKRFFSGEESERKFYYLDLIPDTIASKSGHRYVRNSTLYWGIKRCFAETDLYTTQFSKIKSTDIEKRFFGRIDLEGKNSVECWANYTHPSADYDAFKALLTYLSVQKLRTPKGLSFLTSVASSSDQNMIMKAMVDLHKMHSAIWTESVWCIAHRASDAPGFLLSDHPVTVYNPMCFPGSKVCKGAGDPDIRLIGTHTLFPLDLDKILIFTNLSWARNPYENPLKVRPNPDLFRAALFNFMTVQTGRELDRSEVLKINTIIKKRAYRYIAASKEEWLYPEESLGIIRWDKLSASYLLMPDPRGVQMISEFMMGFDGGRVLAVDDYGLQPGQKDYKDRERFSHEMLTSQAFKGEYARMFGPKRRGLTFNNVKIDNEIDSEEMHQYHLNLEAKFKAKAGIKRNSWK